MQNCTDYENLDHCLEEAAAEVFFFTSALAVSTAGPGFVVLGGFSRLLSMVSMVALASFLVASSPARFSVSLVGTSFFLVEETVGVLETKEEGFLAEEMLPCSLDSSWRKLSGLGRNVYTHLRPNLIVD